MRAILRPSKIVDNVIGLEEDFKIEFPKRAGQKQKSLIFQR